MDQTGKRGQIERSETLSALASYFDRWSPEDPTLFFDKVAQRHAAEQCEEEREA